MSVSNIQIKVRRAEEDEEDEHRCISIPENASWDQFQRELDQIFGSGSGAKYRVQYQDEEGDWITMSSAWELSSAVKCCMGAPLRVVLRSMGQVASSSIGTHDSGGESVSRGPVLAEVISL